MDLDGLRMLTDGLEVSSVLPLAESADTAAVLVWAAAVARASGSPWGGAFPLPGRIEPAEGFFNGRVATAQVGGVRYVLGPVAALGMTDETERLRQRGEYYCCYGASATRACCGTGRP